MSPLPKFRERQKQTPEEAIHDYIASHKSGIGRLVQGVFEIRTLDEAEKLSTMLANNYPMPERAATGVWELMSNAIEHGNLEIDHAEKARLLEKGIFSDEVARRLTSSPYADRLATIIFRRTKTMIRLRIADEGKGFDYAKYLNAACPSEGPNGRGIMIAAQVSFDKVIYRRAGTMVDAITYL